MEQIKGRNHYNLFINYKKFEMMKKKLLLLFALALVATATALADVEINEANFPDPVFREWVTLWDTDSSGALSDQELFDAGGDPQNPEQEPHAIFLNNKGITNLKGIEHFKYCTYLNITGNQIKDVDVSALPDLGTISCYGIGLESIQFHPNLSRLLAYSNNLTELNIPENSLLTEMILDNNQLTHLVLPNLASLIFLQIKNNPLVELDVANAPNLATLDCCIGQLETINLSNNRELVTLYANGNKLNTLDLSHNTKIQRLYLNSNNLTKLDVSPQTELRWLYVAYNPLETLIMGNNRKMEIMVVAFTNLEDLDLSSCIGMTHLVAPGNKFKQIDLSKNISLNELDLSSNQIKELDISNSPYLMRVLLHNNQMEKLKFTPGMTGIMMTLFNNQFKDEALDEIYKSMVFMTENLGGLAAWVYNDNNDYIEGNEFNYTYTTALGQGLEMGFGCTLFPYSGNPEDVTLDNMFEVLPMQMDQLYDGCPSVVLDENGYATFSCLAPMNLDNVYGPKIYKVEMAEGNRAQLSEATGQVDAETGIVLIGQPGEEVYIPSAVFDWMSSGWVCSPLENNLLAGN